MLSVRILHDVSACSYVTNRWTTRAHNFCIKSADSLLTDRHMQYTDSLVCYNKCASAPINLPFIHHRIVRRQNWWNWVKFRGYFQHSEASTHHQWECNTWRLDALDNPHDGRKSDLNQREIMNAWRLYMTKVDVVRLILYRHEHYQDPFDKLTACKEQIQQIIINC